MGNKNKNNKDNKIKKKYNANRKRTSVFHYMYWKPWYRIDWHIKSIFKIFKWSWQRITRGYCDYDRYDIDHWFLEVVPELLDEFSDKTYSYPLWCDEACPSAPYELWQDTVREMSAHLKNGRESVKDKFYESYHTYTKEEALQMGIDIEKKREEEAQKGLELFVKYFNQLWD